MVGTNLPHGRGVLRSVNIRALFFASYRDIAGAPEITVDLPDGASAADLVAGLRARSAAWHALPEYPAVAVNRTYSPLRTTLRDGDEVAFIPPVSGG